MRDLKQLKRSAKHFNLASRRFHAARAPVRTPCYTSLCLLVFRPILSFRCVFLSSYPLDVRSQTRRVGDAPRPAFARRERENGCEEWFGRVASRREAEDAQDGPTSIKRGQEKCEEDRKEPRVLRVGGRTAAAAAVAAVTAGGWLNPGLFARSKWRSAVILKFSRWQGARIGLKNQSGSLFLMITASRPESGNCWCRCFLPIPRPCHLPLYPSLSLCLLHPRTEPVFRLFSWLAAPAVSFPVTLSPTSLPPPSLPPLHPASLRSVPSDSPNLSPVSSPPPTIAIAIVNHFKYSYTYI